MPLHDELKVLDAEENKLIMEEREASSSEGGFSPENKAEFEKSLTMHSKLWTSRFEG